MSEPSPDTLGERYEAAMGSLRMLSLLVVSLVPDLGDNWYAMHLLRQATELLEAYDEERYPGLRATRRR